MVDSMCDLKKGNMNFTVYQFQPSIALIISITSRWWVMETFVSPLVFPLVELNSLFQWPDQKCGDKANRRYLGSRPLLMG